MAPCSISVSLSSLHRALILLFPLLFLVPAVQAVPLSLAHGTGDMLLLEGASQSVLRISPAGAVSVEVARNDILALTGGSRAYFNDRGIAVDARGDFYFTDYMTCILLKKSGDQLSVLVHPSRSYDLLGGVVDPNGLVVGGDSGLYASDELSDSVLRIDAESGELRIFTAHEAMAGLPGIAGVNLVGGMAIGHDETIYVQTDRDVDAIFAIDESGAPRVLVTEDDLRALGVEHPSFSGFMTIAPNGDLIVASTDMPRSIYRITPAGQISLFLSEETLTAVVGTLGTLSIGAGMAFDSLGNFYLAEEGSDSIFKWLVADMATGTIDAASGFSFVSAQTLYDATGYYPDLKGGIAFLPVPAPSSLARVQAVPTPASLPLLGIGLLTLVVMRRRGRVR